MGNFELDLISHLFYKFVTVVSSILLYHMYGRRIILFFIALEDFDVRWDGGGGGGGVLSLCMVVVI